MLTRSVRILILSCACLPLAAQTVMAAGYAIKEQSATAQGNAFAGATAGAEDISYMFFNPAGLTRHGGIQAQGVASYIMPKADPKNGSGTDALGANGLVGSDGGDAAQDALVASFYGSGQINDWIFVGLGVNAPFGLKTTYDEGWIGRYHGVSSSLKTLNINPNVAVEVNNWLSLGVGFQAQYADARLTQAIDTGTLAGLPDGGTAVQDSFGDVRGDDWGFGYTLGVLVEPMDGTRIGVGFRSKVEHTLDGDARFTLSAAGQGVSAMTSAFQRTGAEAKLTTPASLSAGIYQKLTDQIAVMGEFAWTDWSEFNELRIQFNNPAQADSVTTENWDDAYFAAVGATYMPTDAWTLRAGIAYDQSPVPGSTRTPRIPDGDRYWISVGASYQPLEWLALSAGYTHIFVEDTSVRLSGTGENLLRGSLDVDYENQIDIFVLSGRVSF